MYLGSTSNGDTLCSFRGEEDICIRYSRELFIVWRISTNESDQEDGW
jgi:hypothetical protein